MKFLFLLGLLFPSLVFSAPAPPLISAASPLVLTSGVMSVSQTLPFGVITQAQQSTPANPSSGRFKLYFKSDGTLYSLNSSGTETPIGASPALGDLTSGTTGLTVTNGTDAVVGSGTSLTIQTASNSQPGLLSAADHTTFAAKQDALTIGNITSGTTGVSIGGGTGAIIGSGVTVSVQTASNSQPGLLSAADHTTFAAKQAAGSYITDLTSDVSASGPGSVAATVNSVGGSSAANVHAAELLANAATSANTASAIVKRGASGEFSAGGITSSSETVASPSTGTATNNPTANISVKGDGTNSGWMVLGDGVTAIGSLVSYGSVARLKGYRSGGTAASPSAITGASGILQLETLANDGTNGFVAGGSVQIRSGSTWTGSSRHTQFVVNTVASGSTSSAQALLLDQAATIGVSGNTTANVLNGPLTMTGSSAINLIWATDGAGNIGASNATRPDNAYIKTLASLGDSTSGTNYLKLEAASAQISFGNSGSSWIGNGGVNAVMEAHGGGQAFIMDSTGFTHYGMVHLNPMTTATRDGYGGATGQFLYNSSLSRYQGYDGSYFSFVTPTSTDTLTNKTLTAPIIATISNTGTLTLPTSTDTLIGRATTDTLTNKTLSSAIVTTQLTFGNYHIEPGVNALGSITGSNAVDLSVKSTITATLTGAVTISALNNPGAAGSVYQFIFTQNGTGGYAITWPGTITRWMNSGGSAPIAGGASKLLIVTLTCYDGTNFYGSFVQDY